MTENKKHYYCDEYEIIGDNNDDNINLVFNKMSINIGCLKDDIYKIDWSYNYKYNYNNNYNHNNVNNNRNNNNNSINNSIKNDYNDNDIVFFTERVKIDNVIISEIPYSINDLTQLRYGIAYYKLNEGSHNVLIEFDTDTKHQVNYLKISNLQINCNGLLVKYQD